jgi:hypothetical protein
MATMHGTIDKPLEDVSEAVRSAAADEGYSPAEESGPYTLVFRKGSSGFGRGSRATVQLRASSASQTDVTISVEENWAITDWGRSRRAARHLLDKVGAQHS